MITDLFHICKFLVPDLRLINISIKTYKFGFGQNEFYTFFTYSANFGALSMINIYFKIYNNLVNDIDSKKLQIWDTQWELIV